MTLTQMYTLSKRSLPMDIEFMLSDTFELLRPKLVKFQTFAEAAQAVDEMMAAAASKNGEWLGVKSVVRWHRLPEFMLCSVRFCSEGPIEEEVDEAVEEERRVAVASDGESSSSDESSSEVSQLIRLLVGLPDTLILTTVYLSGRL